MKLSDAYTATLEESRFAFSVPITEDEEGPRWKFGYSNARQDPSPDILLLGAYRHPNTGNNLIGGINLHYLNKKERDELARNLPNIMGGGNLYKRYWIGRRVSPSIFNKYYRLYLSAKMMNALGNNYEVVRSFPMPGRYFQFTLKFKYK